MPSPPHLEGSVTTWETKALKQYMCGEKIHLVLKCNVEWYFKPKQQQSKDLLVGVMGYKYHHLDPTCLLTIATASYNLSLQCIREQCPICTQPVVKALSELFLLFWRGKKKIQCFLFLKAPLSLLVECLFHCLLHSGGHFTYKEWLQGTGTIWIL